MPGDSAKIIAPRLLGGTQWGMICPIHTPDGGNVGLHKHLSISSQITTGCSGRPLIRWLRTVGLSLLDESALLYLAKTTKVFVNGAWVGVHRRPQDLVPLVKLYRLNGIIPLYWSIYWNMERQEILLWTDAGRLTRPVFYIHDKKISYENPIAAQRMAEGSVTWKECVSGFGKKKKDIPVDACIIPNANDVYEFGGDLAKLRENAAIVTYLDVQEEEGALISNESISPLTTHVEIHPSLILGIMANMIVFPENNPYPRDLFSCGQSKQAVSIFHTNYQNRIDKMSVVLNYGEIPLVKSRYLKIVTNEQHPYGENAIVAIACFTGFNVEDAVIFNRGSLDRGIFRTTYFTMYEAHEESSKVGDTIIDSKFCNVEDDNVVGLKPGFDYSHLDEYGLIKENTPINDKTILIGKCMNSLTSSSIMMDMSKGPKKGQLGMVDKSFMTEGAEGYRLAKVRIREERVPGMGDKFSSRVGQKGTIGLILEEENMPFTAQGVRPDIIVNPHAMPSRMTIGQLIECLMGKAGVLYGGFGDCTAWVNKGTKEKTFGDMLLKQGYHSSGTEVLYNGMTGEQLEANIYMGPTYYMRLKHMVKDKINYRTRGPRAALTRQTIGGRAKDGGLRIGEMDRDVIIGHGMSEFLNESFLERGDGYFVAICNKTGTIAIYNESKDIFLSPMADGPIKFVANKDNDLNLVNISRFGRSFSIIRIPYAFKLLYQELQAMNIQMRIITDDNVDQLTSLKKGDDVQKLTSFNTIIEVAQETRRKLRMEKQRKSRAPKEEKRVASRQTRARSPIAPDVPPVEEESADTQADFHEAVVPADKKPGDILIVELEDGDEIEVTIPDDVGPGDIIQFEVSPKSSSQEEKKAAPTPFAKPTPNVESATVNMTHNPYAPPGAQYAPQQTEGAAEGVAEGAAEEATAPDNSDAEDSSPDYQASPPPSDAEDSSPAYQASSPEDEPVEESNLLTTIEKEEGEEGEDEKGDIKKIN